LQKSRTVLNVKVSCFGGIRERVDFGGVRNVVTLSHIRVLEER
jgi:hypothetical protein